MSLKHLARYAFSLPPHIALVKVAAYGGRVFKAYLNQITKRTRLSYEPVRKGVSQDFLTGHKVKCSKAVRRNLSAVSALVQKHHFNILGSDWVKVAPAPGDSKVSPGNRVRLTAIRELIDAGYVSIDWQLDFKSGYRWREDRLSGTLRYGHEPGVDVKVPWELARMQHLLWLAFVADEKSIAEFRNQVLDFAAANPPGYGINWLCTMDVAIRAANLLLAHDLFVGKGITFDDGFRGEFSALIVAHGKHIRNNLEWHVQYRANHYLANICGLLFVAAYLPRTDETSEWLSFSIEQLIAEVERQFTPDGANFEASTSYHRLSAEMVVYATALALGLDDAPEFPPWYFERLERMAEFIIHVTKPNGRVAQIGDNDSGRFFKLCPLPCLDHRATVAAINGLFDRTDFAAFAGPDTELETSVIKALSGGRTIRTSRTLGRTMEGRAGGWQTSAETIIAPPDGAVFDGLETFAYPDFGLYIWRSPRLFLSVRCGPIGQNGNGGHAHNDQLAIELNIDGEDWIADPGTYLYTPSPKGRDAYRSVHAHAAPRVGGREPARLDLGLFRLEDRAKARCLSFGADGFEGTHVGYGKPVYRRVTIGGDCIRIQDGGVETRDPVTVHDAEALRTLWCLDLPFSPGYGLRDIL